MLGDSRCDAPVRCLRSRHCPWLVAAGSCNGLAIELDVGAGGYADTRLRTALLPERAPALSKMAPRLVAGYLRLRNACSVMGVRTRGDERRSGGNQPAGHRRAASGGRAADGRGYGGAVAYRLPGFAGQSGGEVLALSG